MGKHGKKSAFGAFGAYILLMLWLLFGQRWGMDAPGTYLQQLRENLNLVPLHTIRGFFHTLDSSNPYLVRHAVINLAGNVVMFVPLGFFLSLLFEPLRAYRRHLVCVLLILLVIELVQLLSLLGSCDVDDFLLNVPGTAIGYGICRWILPKTGKNGHKS